MIHPRLTPIGSTAPTFLAAIGTYGSWGDLSWTTRWGDGACGMFEASWTMPLPPDFDHPLLRRGTLVELMDGPWRVGSPLILSEPARGTGLDDPWKFTATGIGREVEGEHSYYCFDGSGNATSVATTAVDQAITNGWRIAGRDTSVPSVPLGSSSTTAELNTVGSLLKGVADSNNVRWLVDQTNTVGFRSDPTTPTYHVTPGAAALGVADDDFASVVYGRYINSATGAYATVTAFNSQAQAQYGRREYAADLTDLGAISTATAQSFADGILAKAKGRLGWTNGLTLTSQELLTSGGVPADLSKVSEDVGTGCMVRIHGIFNDLLAYNGQTWLDIIIGEAKYTDGGQTIDLSPLGLAARDLAAITEEVTGMAVAA